jgi:DNA polymerase-3 subunit delta'
MSESLQPFPWQQEAWQRVQRARAAGRLPHALLLEGPGGLGKRHFADMLARAVLCSEPRPDGTACGACRSCRLTSAGTHPDLSLMEPEEAGGQIRIDAVRDLAARERLTAQAGGYKVVLFDPADAMNPAAANALLKTLEEPSAWWLMLLITQNPSRLPATIRSRCQRLSFSPPPEDVAMEWLSRRVGAVDPHLVFGLSGGTPLRALALAEGGLLDARAQMLADLIAVMKGSRDPVAVAEAWNKAGPEQALEWLVGWVLDMTRLKASARPALVFNPDKLETLAEIAHGMSSQTLHRLGARTLETRALLGTQVNTHLLLEGLLLEWASEAPSAGKGGVRRSSRPSRAQR